MNRLFSRSVKYVNFNAVAIIVYERHVRQTCIGMITEYVYQRRLTTCFSKKCGEYVRKYLKNTVKYVLEAEALINGGEPL